MKLHQSSAFHCQQNNNLDNMPHAHTNATELDGGVITLTDSNYSTVILLRPLVCLNSEPRSGSLFSQRFQIKTNSVNVPSVSNTLHSMP